MMLVKPRFPLGRLVATAQAMRSLTEDDVRNALHRHRSGDWGNVCEEDRQANDRALRDGLRLLSVYRGADGTTFWIITEANRSVTTILLPEDY